MLHYRYWLIILLISLPAFSIAQELYPNTEPASTIPKGVFGLRLMGDTYSENGQDRNSIGLRAMYGVTSRLSVWLQGGLANHHDTVLPANLITHTHSGNTISYYTNTKTYGRKYPYRFKTLRAYAKYRIFSSDGEQKHFRVALFGEYSLPGTAHDEAEPNFNDNSGYGGGLIITQLYRRLAISFTTGFMHPFSYTETVNHPGFLAYTPQVTTISYGQAITYSLSAGYRVFPKEYTGYAQSNYNLYIELIGKSFDKALVVQDGQRIDETSRSFHAGNYTDIYLGVQKIINSNTRIDLSVVLPFYKRSYQHFYPVLMLGVQTYFYRRAAGK